MNGIGKKVTLETIYNTLFTVGITLIMMGVGLIEGANVELTEGLKPIGLGVVLLGVGAFIYWLKIQEPQQDPPIDEPKLTKESE